MAYRDKERQGHFDLESLETYMRDSMHQIGSIMLEKILNSDNGGFQGTTIPCSKGSKGSKTHSNHSFIFKEYRNKKLLTVLGSVRVKRAYYYDRECKEGYCPKDAALDIMDTSLSPGVRRIMARVGALRPFGLGHEDIKEMAGIEVNSKEIERVSYQLGTDVEKYFKSKYNDDAHLPCLTPTPPNSSPGGNNIIQWKPMTKMYICMDGTGVPVVKKETKNRKGKNKDGQAKTREAKLGCIFTQTTVDQKGYPVRDEGSTSYVGYIETAEEFGDRLYDEALSRGLESAQTVCVIGDGAAWIWNIADFHFKGAIQIIDLFHAREHYWTVAKKCLSGDNQTLKKWTKKRRKELDSGKVEKVIEAIKQISPATEEEKEIVEKEINYFEKNKERMRYKAFRKQGLFVGSGVVEAGCRAVIGQRLKQSGMHWTVGAANNIIALRCCILSNRWEDFWEYRAS
jgi:hypothetical protein